MNTDFNVLLINLFLMDSTLELISPDDYDAKEVFYLCNELILKWMIT